MDSKWYIAEDDSFSDEVAPLVLWPTDAINGVTMVHLSAAFTALLAAYITRKVIWGMLAGLVVFFSPVIITLL
tara:strand:+ start:432 stop:650 length:219 start_codon:yes stop_codon:yes gene_type:complete